MAPLKRRPSRADVGRSLRELETLWRPPDAENETAQAGTRAADNENSERNKSNAERAPNASGRR